jgi:hypothetical protein
MSLSLSLSIYLPLSLYLSFSLSSHLSSFALRRRAALKCWQTGEIATFALAVKKLFAINLKNKPWSTKFAYNKAVRIKRELYEMIEENRECSGRRICKLICFFFFFACNLASTKPDVTPARCFDDPFVFLLRSQPALAPIRLPACYVNVLILLHAPDKPLLRGRNRHWERDSAIFVIWMSLNSQKTDRWVLAGAHCSRVATLANIVHFSKPFICIKLLEIKILWVVEFLILGSVHSLGKVYEGRFRRRLHWHQ